MYGEAGCSLVFQFLVPCIAQRAESKSFSRRRPKKQKGQVSTFKENLGVRSSFLTHHIRIEQSAWPRGVRQALRGDRQWSQGVPLEEQELRSFEAKGEKSMEQGESSFAAPVKYLRFERGRQTDPGTIVPTYPSTICLNYPSTICLSYGAGPG